MNSFERGRIVTRLAEIDQDLCRPEILKNSARIRFLTAERADLARIQGVLEELDRLETDILDLKEVLEEDDAELVQMAREELSSLVNRETVLETRLRMLLIPPDPNDARDVVMEIRAGTGGEEAALFAADIFRMYTDYAQKTGWQTEVLGSRESERGGLKEVIFSLSGQKVYSRMKFEAGVHRVQRVPLTETSGRTHTSACTVAVLPEAEEIEVDICPEDLRVDVYRSSGPGGQSVNTTDSAVRITHLPTGLVVSCQDEKSQHKNKAKAMKVLRSRLLAAMQAEEASRRSEVRKGMVGSGDRSAKIRTYNFPQNRVTDHRIHLTLHNLDEVLAGNLDQIIDALAGAEQERLLSEISMGEKQQQ
jgi:peptide chain release factor 1